MDKAASAGAAPSKDSVATPTQPVKPLSDYNTDTWFQTAVLCHRVLTSLYKSPRVPIATFIRCVHIF